MGEKQNEELMKKIIQKLDYIIGFLFIILCTLIGPFIGSLL